MSVTVTFMGILAEKAGKSEVLINKTGTKSSILEHVYSSHPEFRELNFVVSHNGVIMHSEAQIKSGDCLTLIPPSPGG